MRPLLQRIDNPPAPEDVAEALAHLPGCILLRSSLVDAPRGRYSLLTAHPFLEFIARGPRCTLRSSHHHATTFGNPWLVLEEWMARYEILDEVDLPFPAGGCFGFWGYELMHPLEPRIQRDSIDDLEWPDCSLGFYDSVVIFDHHLDAAWIVATGLALDGSRDPSRAQSQLQYWLDQCRHPRPAAQSAQPSYARPDTLTPSTIRSNLTPSAYMDGVRTAQSLITQGHIYQVNLAHRLEASLPGSPWNFFRSLGNLSPAPYAAYLNCGEFQIASSSPELFLRMSGAAIATRPIKGTRPRSSDPTRDAQLAFELQTSPKEIAELVMITDLLRNDLGKICDFGSVQVPDLVRLERFAHVHHLVSTIEGRLKSGISHCAALAACFPGGSITGAPKVRAMEIINQLEPHTRGPYTGCAGYLGFNRESQLSILIRTALIRNATAWFHVGAGIVADSNPEAEYHETIAKAQGFLAALNHASISQPLSLPPRNHPCQDPTPDAG